VLIVGLALFAGGLVWFAQLPVRGSYLADVLGPSLLIALGLGLTFVPITILAETGVEDREYGLASGLVNTSQQIGGALGLAVLTTIATTRTNHFAAAHHPTNQALTLGFHAAFLGAAGFVLLGIIAAASIGTWRVKHRQALTASAKSEPGSEPVHPVRRRAAAHPAPTYCYDCLSTAGWSSLVARRAHNPKVAGSNPAPAIEADQGVGPKKPCKPAD
jgi:MFS family permease